MAKTNKGCASRESECKRVQPRRRTPQCKVMRAESEHGNTPDGSFWILWHKVIFFESDSALSLFLCEYRCFQSSFLAQMKPATSLVHSDRLWALLRTWDCRRRPSFCLYFPSPHVSRRRFCRGKPAASLTRARVQNGLILTTLSISSIPCILNLRVPFNHHSNNLLHSQPTPNSQSQWPPQAKLRSPPPPPARFARFIDSWVFRPRKLT